MNKNNQSQSLPCQQAGTSGGYIALISTIIISVLMMGVVFATSHAGFIGRFNILNTEFKELSSGLAEACVDMALLKLAQSKSYAGNESISVGNSQCLILPIETSPGQKTIKTKATFQNSVTNLKIVAKDTDLSVISWEEVAKF